MVLGLDTSGKTLGLAVCAEGEIKGSRLLKPGLRHGEIIQKELNEFLGVCDLGFDDLTGIAVTLGPGSFTGLRIGLAAAKGYAYAKNIPLTGISTLYAGAHALANSAAKVIVFIDAFKDEVYYAVFDCSGDRPIRITPDDVASAGKLRADMDDSYVLFNPSPLKSKLHAEFESFKRCTGDDFNMAIPAAFRGEEDIKNNRILDFSSVVPFYIRTGF
jgi:tRNA threonylcarbamoyladenosine biosynthesis protein TsaB